MRPFGNLMAWSLLFVALGCGGSDLGTPVDVTGTITVSKKPLANATVTFIGMGNLPADKRAGVGTTDASGTYSIPKLYPAEYMVQIVEKPVQIDPNQPPPATPVEGPLAKYAGDSPLRAKVGEGSAKFDFDL